MARRAGGRNKTGSGWLSAFKPRAWLYKLILSVVAVAIGFISLIGVRNIIEGVARETVAAELQTMKGSVEETKRHAYNAEDAAKRASDAAHALQGKASSLALQVDDLEQRITKVQRSARDLPLTVGQVVEGERRNLRAGIEYDVNDLRKELTRLNRLVAELGRRTEGGEPLVHAYQAQTAENRQVTEAERKSFDENSSFRVFVYSKRPVQEKAGEFAGQVVKMLEKAGFKPSIRSLEATAEGGTGEETPNLDRMSVSTITYSNDEASEKKAKDVVQSLQTVVVLHLESPADFTRKYWNPFISRESIGLFSRERLIELYLVK